MPLLIVRDDITTMKVDAIVNAAKNSLLGGGGVDGQIHRAAGPELLAECRTLGGCETGQAKITKGYNLPARYVIHAVGPVWQGGGHGEKELLASCYQNALQLAYDRGLESIAFPLISSGIYGYPKRQALEVAADAIRNFLDSHDMLVYLAVFDKQALDAGKGLFQDIQSFIDEKYVEERAPWLDARCRKADEAAFSRHLAEYDVQASRMEDTLPFPAGKETEEALKPQASQARRLPDVPLERPRPRKRGLSLPRIHWEKRTRKAADQADIPELAQAMPAESMGAPAAPAMHDTLEDILRNVDETFSQTLLRLIDLSGMTDPECYKKANVDRKLFSKIRSDIHYRPSKQTAIAFALALEMDLAATQDLLRRAGYALSPSSKADLIVEYFIRHGQYDIFEINQALFAYDQVLLGA